MTDSNIAEFKAIAPAAKFDMSPTNFTEMMQMADRFADSNMVPKDFIGKPGNVLVAIQWGMEIGLKPLQAMQNIAVINGRPCLWGDAVIALARSSAACEYIIETQTATEATCKVKRRGEAEQVRTFSMTDAKLAGLSGKQGPWTQYPKRMMQMRARAFAIRDVFPDVLKGLAFAEEVMDLPRDMGLVQQVAPASNNGLLEQAEAAASMGVATYQAFWAKASKEDRKSLAGEHERLKATASSADKARTIDQGTGGINTPLATANKTFDEVMAMLCKAETMDALFVAGEWIHSIADEADQGILNAKFDEIRANIENGAA